MTSTLDGTARGVGPDEAYQALARLDEPCCVVTDGQGGHRLVNEVPADPTTVVAAVGPLPPESLGSPVFRRRHGLRHAYMGGAMAGGISSEELVEALGRTGRLGSFGAAGLPASHVDAAVGRLATRLADGPWAVNVIHSPSEDALERDGVEIALRHGVSCVEASAFVKLTPHLVRYRVSGLRRGSDGEVVAGHRLIAKVSRAEVAATFMEPPPESMVADLRERGLVSAEQAELARRCPMADDVTAEADSGGHTDRRPLSVLVPALLAVRDDIQDRLRYHVPVGVGAGGGLGTPRALAAAFALGAEYVVLGSVHQACRESGTSTAVRAMLARAGTTDVGMAPAADMFELGVELQVLKKGTFFPMRAQRLLACYRRYDGVESIPATERAQLEQQIFRRPLEEIWEDVRAYFEARDPDQLRRAVESPKRRMALLFRWYLGMASRWAVVGDADRTADYQVWCGPAMGAFNEWTAGTALAEPAARGVADVAAHLQRGAAYALRVHQLALMGVRVPRALADYRLPVAP